MSCSYYFTYGRSPLLFLLALGLVFGPSSFCLPPSFLLRPPPLTQKKLAEQLEKKKKKGGFPPLKELEIRKRAPPPRKRGKKKEIFLFLCLLLPSSPPTSFRLAAAASISPFFPSPPLSPLSSFVRSFVHLRAWPNAINHSPPLPSSYGGWRERRRRRVGWGRGGRRRRRDYSSTEGGRKLHHSSSFSPLAIPLLLSSLPFGEPATELQRGGEPRQTQQRRRGKSSGVFLASTFPYIRAACYMWCFFVLYVHIR